MLRINLCKRVPAGFKNLHWHGIRSLTTSSSSEIEIPSLVPVNGNFDGNKRSLTIALVGRPNTGKSTLFNRLTQTKKAIVSAVPGTTRDRREGVGYLAGMPLHIVDTGGLDDRGEVTTHIKQQVRWAVRDADVILFMLDSRTGVTALDRHFAQWLRSTIGQYEEVIPIANKAEGAFGSDALQDTAAEGLRLGFGEVVPLSAAHGDGLADLATMLVLEARARDCAEEEVPERTIQMALMGRPNVGKSTLLNAIVGSDRVIAGPVAGLTRDAVPVGWKYKGRQFILVDTAGLTRTRTVPAFLDHSYLINELSLLSALNALKYAQVVCIVVDAEQQNFSKVDLSLARLCLTEGRGLVILANKLDLMDRVGMSATAFAASVKEHADEFLREFGDIPVIPTSGLQGRGVDRAMKEIIRTHDSWSRRIDTWVLNQWIKDTMTSAPRPRAGDKDVNIKYMTQVTSRPPEFLLSANVAELPRHFERFLRAKIQHDFSLRGVPVRFIVRKSKGNPVKKELLKHNLTNRRHKGHAEGRGVGPRKRKVNIAVKRHVVGDARDLRRRRDTRQKRVLRK
eukprot:GSChrysophyteH1.ASY1.ANO1.259.1 assembled CDS